MIINIKMWLFYVQYDWKYNFVNFKKRIWDNGHGSLNKIFISEKKTFIYRLKICALNSEFSNNYAGQLNCFTVHSCHGRV